MNRPISESGTFDSRVGVLDYGVGNIGSIVRAFSHVGVKCSRVSSVSDVLDCSHLVLPGVGSFDHCVMALRSSGLLPTLVERVIEHSVPLLGICVGAQMLGKSSAEGLSKGLDLIDMETVKITGSAALKIPHVGWGKLYASVSTPSCFLTQGVQGGRVYFTHSFYMVPKHDENILFTSTYESSFCSAVHKGHILGLQFHPEKSQAAGLEILRIFATNYVY